MSHTVADIMTKDVITLSPESTLFDAHELSKTKGIRHIPVVASDNTLVAVVTQKQLVGKVMQILSDFGERAISRKEKLTPIMDVAQRDFTSVKADQPLLEIAEFFLSNKHGCLPVIDEQSKIVGIITSSDFIKLTITLLKQT